MPPTILVICATGDTGQGVVRHLPKLFKSSKTNCRILGLTRSLHSPASQKLAGLSKVEMQEKKWTSVDATWLRNQEVARFYIAPHNMPDQLTDESALHVALLNAGVKYVVKVSTNMEYIGSTNSVFYGRTHKAIENLLSQPEFNDLQWTSLEPNFFTTSYLAAAAEWIKAYRKAGKQETLAMVRATDAAVAMIDPEDVGKVGAHLLALEDTAPHNQARYVLSGPEDVTGKRIVELVEHHAGVKVQRVRFEDTSWLSGLVEGDLYPAKVLPSLLAGCEPLWQGKCSLARTSTTKEVMDLAPPSRTSEESLLALLAKQALLTRLDTE